MIECTIPDEPAEQREDVPQVSISGGPPEANGDSWAMYVDGSSNSAGSGVGLIFMSPEGMIVEYAFVA